MSEVDLHIHSSVSDGRFSPAEIVRKAAGAGLKVIALTDHDSIDGIASAIEAAGEFPGLRVIPGVEISSDVPQGEAHMLGYFIDTTDRELLENLVNMRNSRVKRAREMIARLAGLGMNISWERVHEIAGSGSVGRPHIAQALLEKGYISSVKEAFNKYIAWGGPAYVLREKVTPAEAVALILRADGLPVLAHPLTVAGHETLIAGLAPGGLAGIEAYYGEFSNEEIKKLVDLADKHGLITTGGSDYHGLDDKAETVLGGADVPMECADRLISLARQRKLKTAG
ncbi:MAG: PHP domain-containing protein [Chloroflexota bacterium]